MHLHILGICGTFMGGIAALARQAGHTVTGCDANVYPPMSTQLRTLGIDLIEGYDAAQLTGVAKDADVFVIGNAISRGNPLLEAVLDVLLAVGRAGRPVERGLVVGQPDRHPDGGQERGQGGDQDEAPQVPDRGREGVGEEATERARRSGPCPPS